MAQPEIRIEGLEEFRRALRNVDRELPKDLRATMRREVADPVAARIRARVPVGPGKGGHWREVIRGGATQRSAYIQWGRAKVPYAAWIEFGGGIPNKRNRGGRPPRISRPYKPDGRFVYPMVERHRDQAAVAAQRAVRQTMARARLHLE